MRVLQYIIRRLLIAVFVVLCVVLLVFVLSRISGDPLAIYMHPEMSQEDVAQLEVRFGLDKPFLVQYVLYVAGLFRGDFGYSPTAREPVLRALARKIPATLELSLLSMALAMAAGVILGTWSARFQDTIIDHLSRVGALWGLSTPLFWFELMLILLLYYQWNVLPLGRSTDVIWASIRHPTGIYLLDSVLAGSGRAIIDTLSHMVMPVFSLAFVSVGPITRMMRSSILEVLREDYVTTARAKGITERRVYSKHVRRNALIPTVTAAGITLGFLLGGTVITETVFAWPGLGRWGVTAILTGDQAAIMAYVLFMAVVFSVVNLIVDVVVVWLDPRLSL